MDTAVYRSILKTIHIYVLSHICRKQRVVLGSVKGNRFRMGDRLRIADFLTHDNGAGFEAISVDRYVQRPLECA